MKLLSGNRVLFSSIRLWGENGKKLCLLFDFSGEVWDNVCRKQEGGQRYETFGSR